MRIRFTFLALAMLLGASACAADPGSSGSTASPDDSGSSGGPSPSSSTAGSAGSAAGIWGDPANSREPSLELHEDGRLTGTDGCNRLMGRWVVDGGKVLFQEVAMTMRACPDVDQWLASAASAVPGADTLLVYDGDGNEIGSLTR